MSDQFSTHSVLLKVVFWIELIIAARILFFTVPVLLDNMRSGRMDASVFQNWPVMTLTVIALLYLIVAVASLMSFQGWKLFQYFAALLTIVLMTALIRKAMQSTTEVSWLYSAPVLFAVVTTGCVALLKPAGD